MLSKLDKHGENSGFPYVLFSLYQILNYALIYPAWIWQTQQYIYPFWRLEFISCIIFLVLALRKYWPRLIKKYYALCWCLAVGWSLPFSNTIFLLRDYTNDIGGVTDCIIALFTLALIVDWLSFSIILAIVSVVV